MRKIYKTPTAKFRNIVLSEIMSGSSEQRSMRYSNDNSQSTNSNAVTEADAKASYWSTEW